MGTTDCSVERRREGRGGKQNPWREEGKGKSRHKAKCLGVVAAPAGHGVSCSKSPPGIRNKDSKLLKYGSRRGWSGE